MLRLQKLSYRLGKKSLIDNISLDFKPSTLHAVLGPNGSGKTTLLKTLANIWPPTSGKVLWQGQNLHEKSRQTISQTMSLVPQQYSISFDFTVKDLVTMGRYAQPGTNSSAIVDRVLHQVDAWNLRNSLVTQLSQGERQRILIARALATESPILLLDEPTASLDLRHQRLIWDLLRELANEGKTILITLHDLKATLDHCDQTIILDKGHCVAQGTPQNVLTPKLLLSTFGI